MGSETTSAKAPELRDPQSSWSAVRPRACIPPSAEGPSDKGASSAEPPEPRAGALPPSDAAFLPEQEAWFATEPPSEEPAVSPSIPPAREAVVVRARLRRRNVVLGAVCTLGGVVFALAAWQGLRRSAASHAADAHVAPSVAPHVPLSASTAPPAPEAPAPSARPAVQSNPAKPARGAVRATASGRAGRATAIPR